MAKQRGSNKTIFISIFAILVITGIVIGVLFATGVLGKKTSGGVPAPPFPPGPTPTPPGPYNPAGYCEQMPTISSFENLGNGNTRLTFTPIAGNCATSKNWMWYYTYNGYGPNGIHIQSETGQSFKPISGQSFQDISFDLPYDNPNGPIRGSVTGQVWLQSVNADGSGDLLFSNKLPYVFFI